MEVGPLRLWNAYEYVRGVPRRLLGSDVHAERPRLLLSAPSAAGIPKAAKGHEQQQQRGEQQMQKRKRGRPAHTAANRRARLIPRMDLSSARKTVLCAMFRLCLVTTPWMFTISCFRTQCVWGGHGRHMRHINLYSRTHAPLSVVTASMPISRSRPPRARPRPSCRTLATRPRSAFFIFN